MAVLLGCGDGRLSTQQIQQQPALEGSASITRHMPEGAEPALPAPALLPRLASFEDSERFKDGADFLAGLPSSRVVTEGSALRFSPQRPGGLAGAGLTGAALAVYGWTLEGYSGPAQLGLEWDSPLSAGIEVWLALANFQQDRWDWQRLSGPASSASLAPLPQHLRADGAVFATLLLLGPASASDPLLERIFIGSSDTVVPGDVQFSVDLSAAPAPISPYIYGVNEIASEDAQAARPSVVRFGGNRWTAYNWENNASNAGSDWFHQNDGFISEDNQPGIAVEDNVNAAFDLDAAAIVTMPIQGYVAADKNGGGDVNQTPNYLNVRFRQNLPAKGSAFSLSPEPADPFVYQDEFLNWLNSSFPGALSASPPRLMISLDNEPDLWSSTHARIQLSPVGYDELIGKSIASMLALRAVVPEAQFFGAVNYGWYGYETLQDAPDAGAHGNFLDYYLEQMKAAELEHGQRLLDVLDVHWYPEARGDGVRITGDEVSAGVVEARLQAPRSLWDAGYIEDSWITEFSTLGPIYLLPRLKQKIAAHYPGTKLAITEYNYGAGGHISGGLAQADVLGVLGREGVYAANIWPLSGDSSFIYAALQLYRDADGDGAAFGDLSLPVDWDDAAGYSAYAAGYSDSAGRLSLVLINKLDASRVTMVQLENAAHSYSSAEVYNLTATGGPQPAQQPQISIPAGSAFNVDLPAYSATLLLLD